MAEKDDQDDAPSNTLEYFAELATIEEMIGALATEHSTNFEKSYEVFSNILSRYQEQPHLLNPHLASLIERLLVYIRDESSPVTLFHAALKYMYQLAKVRTYKVLMKFLPHEITDLDFVLNKLEQQDVNDTLNWETRYMLLLWLSILILNPFAMARFDGFSHDNAETPKPVSKITRIFKLCQVNTNGGDTCSDVAAFLTAKYLIRVDIKDEYLAKYFDWVMASNTAVQFGQLAAVSVILKHGKREDLLPHAANLLKWLLSCDYKNNDDFLKNKFFIKIIQRLGLVFLKPRLALWRYQRGSRSLTANLSSASSETVEFQNAELSQNSDNDIQVPGETEDIIEELLQALRSPSSEVRWSAAKGIGRITNRLPKDFGDEVVGSVIEILSPLEPNEAWHGACLAIAELGEFSFSAN